MKLKNVISAADFNPNLIKSVFTIADKIKANNFKKNALAGKIMATLFYEPSTRTRLSFESAMTRLGGSVISTENASEFSSAAKGETLEDTIRIIDGYCDLIVLRHPKIGSAKIAAQYSDVPVINGGDGGGEHPSQGLLDLYTIFSKTKNSSFTIVMSGALSTYRSVHSLCILLANYPQKVKIIFVSPQNLRIPSDFRNHLKTKKIQFEETENFNTSLKKADFLYQTRIPKEYLSKTEFKKYQNQYVLNKKSMSFMKSNSFVMHPLPRINEIHPEVDSDSRAIYFEQAQNGVYIRMALLLTIFDKD